MGDNNVIKETHELIDLIDDIEFMEKINKILLSKYINENSTD